MNAFFCMLMAIRCMIFPGTLGVGISLKSATLTPLVTDVADCTTATERSTKVFWECFRSWRQPPIRGCGDAKGHRSIRLHHLCRHRQTTALFFLSIFTLPSISCVYSLVRTSSLSYAPNMPMPSWRYRAMDVF